MRGQIVFTSVILSFLLNGCFITKPMVIEYPGPREHQVQASTEQVKHTTSAVVEAQNTKVVAMKETGTEVGVKKLETIQIISTELGKKTDDPQALSNINANAMNAIVRVSNEDRVVREIGQVDGTSKVVGSIAGKGIESTETSTLQYGMYATAQGAIGMQAFPHAVEQMKGVARWGWGKVGMVLGGVFGGGGLIAGLVTFIRRALVRRRLLEADGKVIEELGEEKKEDATLKELKSRLAKAHASLPVDARKEHGLPEKAKKGEETK